MAADSRPPGATSSQGEVCRLWQLSEGYSAAWWWRQPEARKRINAEHKAIISALRRFGLDRLVEICAAHRTGGFERPVSGMTRGAPVPR